MTKNDTQNNKTEDELEDIQEEDENSQDEAQSKVEELENKYKRALADYQNLEKRVWEDKKEWMKSSNRDLITRLLTILDTLMLANKHAEHESLKISIKQFLDTLKSEGVTQIETKGKEFDANTMECVSIIDGVNGKVLEEIRIGFTMNEKLLRPSQVIVGNGKKSS